MGAMQYVHVLPGVADASTRVWEHHLISTLHISQIRSWAGSGLDLMEQEIRRQGGGAGRDLEPAQRFAYAASAGLPAVGQGGTREVEHLARPGLVHAGAVAEADHGRGPRPTLSRLRQQGRDLRVVAEILRQPRGQAPDEGAQGSEEHTAELQSRQYL